jgi:hypothetical protein
VIRNWITNEPARVETRRAKKRLLCVRSQQDDDYNNGKNQNDLRYLRNFKGCPARDKLAAKRHHNSEGNTRISRSLRRRARRLVPTIEWLRNRDPGRPDNARRRAYRFLMRLFAAVSAALTAGVFAADIRRD